MFPTRNIYLVADDLLQSTASCESQRSQLASNQIRIMREKDRVLPTVSLC